MEPRDVGRALIVVRTVGNAGRLATTAVDGLVYGRCSSAFSEWPPEPCTIVSTAPGRLLLVCDSNPADDCDVPGRLRFVKGGSVGLSTERDDDVVGRPL